MNKESSGKWLNKKEPWLDNASRCNDEKIYGLPKSLKGFAYKGKNKLKWIIQTMVDKMNVAATFNETCMSYWLERPVLAL